MQVIKNSLGETLVSGFVTKTFIQDGSGYVFLTTTDGQTVYINLGLTEAYQRSRGQQPYITRKTWLQCWTKPGSNNTLRATHIKEMRLPRRVRRKLFIAKRREQATNRIAA